MLNTAKAYFEGMLWASYGVKLFGGIVAEWQLDAVKEYASKFRR